MKELVVYSDVALSFKCVRKARRVHSLSVKNDTYYINEHFKIELYCDTHRDRNEDSTIRSSVEASQRWGPEGRSATVRGARPVPEGAQREERASEVGTVRRARRQHSP